MSTITAHLEFTEDFGLVVVADDFPYDTLAEVPAAVFTSLGLYDESHEDFSFDEDADYATELVALVLSRKGFRIQAGNLLGAVRQICEPGPPIGIAGNERKNIVVERNDL